MTHEHTRALLPAVAMIVLAGRPASVFAADLAALAPGKLAPGDFRAQAMAAFDGAGRKSGPLAKIGLDLAELHFEYREHLSRGLPGAGFRTSLPGVRIRGGRVVIDVVAAGDAAALRDQLVALGMQQAAVFGRYVSGWFPIAALDRLAALGGLRQARPAFAATRSGVVTSQGDVALGAEQARADFAVDGTGVTVGTLSDSFDCLGGAAADAASDDLPAGVVVLKDDCSSDDHDEGRAMMQIIHDLAPGAAQAFYTAWNGTADFASGIVALATTGNADVINDDVIYFDEPMFQDGAIAQAVDTVKAMGVAYFSAAGNQARQSYESVFVNSGLPGAGTGSVQHDFDPGAGVDGLQQITVAGRETVFIVLQWDQPSFAVSGAPGSASDVDIILFNQGGAAVAGGVDNNIGGDPVEIVGYTNNSAQPRKLQLDIELFAGPEPGIVKYVYFGDMTVDEYATQSPTTYGHPNAAGARAVGAVRYDHAPAYGVDPPVAESFSSVGGVPILFDTAGNAISELRQKPEFMAIDGVDTSFFLDFDYEPNGFPNFFGTSAAAPHAAAVAALLVEFSPAIDPDGVYAALEDTAIDMDAPGVDFDSGHGLIQAGAALTSLLPPPPDGDGDGVPDDEDNCTLVPNGPLIPDAGGNSQLDTDGDGYGNLCDGDLNNNGFTNTQDYAIFRSRLGTSDSTADLNGNGIVNTQDYAIFRSLLGAAPGPSGLVP